MASEPANSHGQSQYGRPHGTFRRVSAEGAFKMQGGPALCGSLNQKCNEHDNTAKNRQQASNGNGRARF